MKLGNLYESELHGVVSKLRRLGALDNPTVRKILASPRHNQSGAKDPAIEADELKRGARLATWQEHPVPGFDSVEYSNGILSFKPENHDVAELLLSISTKTKSNPLANLLNGLVFGYNPKDVCEFTDAGEFAQRMRNWLRQLLGKRINQRLHIIRAGGKAILPIKLKNELAAHGIKTYKPPVAPQQIEYYTAIDIPGDL